MLERIASEIDKNKTELYSIRDQPTVCFVKLYHVKNRKGGGIKSDHNIVSPMMHTGSLQVITIMEPAH